MKFVVGLLVGVGAGVAGTLLAAKRNEDAAGLVGTVQSNARRAIEVAKLAASQREKELWREFHDRVPGPDQPLLG